MYGTIVRYHVKPGMADAFVEEMKGFEAANVAGWFYTTVFRSDADPNQLWASVVFESEEAYKRNAESADMATRYGRLREFFAAEPDWHDGTVIHEAMHSS